MDVGAASAAYMAVVGFAALIESLVGSLRPAWLVGALLSAGWTVVWGGYSTDEMCALFIFRYPPGDSAFCVQ